MPDERQGTVPRSGARVSGHQAGYKAGTGGRVSKMLFAKQNSAVYRGFLEKPNPFFPL